MNCTPKSPTARLNEPRLKIRVHPPNSGGFAIVMVMVLGSVGLMAVTGALLWAAQSALMNERNQVYWATQAAAEAATEKVLAQMSRDYQIGGSATVKNHLSLYSALTLNSLELARWDDFDFVSDSLTGGLAAVTQLSDWQYATLSSKYSGMFGRAASYRIASTVRNLNSSQRTLATVQQEIQLAAIPLFQFAYFYAQDMEFCPGGAMVVPGRVHSNGAIYFEPGGTLTLRGHVTSAKKIRHESHPEDPVTRTIKGVNYLGECDEGVNTLNFPMGTNNTPEVLRTMIEIPPLLEPTNSPIGLHRYYYKADLIVLVSDTDVITKSGAYNNYTTSINWGTMKYYFSTNQTFYNKREAKDIRVTELDLERFTANSSYFTSVLGRPARTVYIADQRTQPMTTQSGVRLINGQTLPSTGLTVATPNPLYVRGHYNAYSSHLGTTNTTKTAPAALIADAVTILSLQWNDRDGGKALPSRVGQAVTVNAAILTGIVPTGGGYYSGGAENVLRLLEDWAGRVLTFNGSICVLFDSRIATGPWGASPDVYNPPIRRFSFDLNFLEEAKLPAGTPDLRTMIRGQWLVL